MCGPESPGELVKYRFMDKASDSVNLWWRGTGIGVVNKLVGDSYAVISVWHLGQVH